MPDGHSSAPAADPSIAAPLQPQRSPEQLEAENDRLRQQVKRLMAAENKLYMLQGHLSAQQRVYVRLAELARNLNTLLDVDKILSAVVEFALYGFDYERCVAFLEESSAPDSVYRAAAFDGYYDDETREHMKNVVLTGEEPALAAVFADPGYVCYADPSQSEGARALGERVLLDQYFVFALARKSGRPLGFLVAGNTRQQARYQNEVTADAKMLAAFSNLASHTATAIGQVRSYRALETERELLDQMVAARTRELSEALDTAHEAVRIKAEFLAKVSHELRTPLNSIINIPAALADDYTQVEVLRCSGCDAEFRFEGEGDATVEHCPDCHAELSRDSRLVCVGDLEEHVRFLKLLQQQGAHLLSLVEDVLDISRLESGRVELNITRVDVAPLLQEIRDTLASANRGTERSILYPEITEPLALLADRVKLKQILINLIGNAVKFTHAGGEIRVDVARSPTNPGELEFTVADDGIGIPEDQLESIFESFRQVDGSHTRNFGGAGLGLAITRQLAEMHGGRVEVESRLNVGSTFHVFMPLDQEVGVEVETATDPASPATGPAPRGFGTVIVVDDEPAQLSMARKLLEREGYEVILVSRGRDVQAAVRRQPVRFVVLDVMMPELNGLTVLSQLASDEATKNIPVFVSSAYHSNKKRALDRGAIWLPKPWTTRTLSAQHLESLLTQLGREELQGDQQPGARQWTRLSQSVSQILYVEDEDANWEVTQLSLRGKYELVRARNSREAFGRLAERGFDLILMDIQLAGSDMNGIEITEALTGIRTESLPAYAIGVRSEAPVVFVTAYTSLYSREQLIASGGHELIAKPVDFTHLLLVVSRLVMKGAILGRACP